MPTTPDLLDRISKLKNPAIYMHPNDYDALRRDLGKCDDDARIPHLHGVPVYVSHSCREGWPIVAQNHGA